MSFRSDITKADERREKRNERTKEKILHMHACGIQHSRIARQLRVSQALVASVCSSAKNEVFV